LNFFSLDFSYGFIPFVRNFVFKVDRHLPFLKTMIYIHVTYRLPTSRGALDYIYIYVNPNQADGRVYIFVFFGVWHLSRSHMLLTVFIIVIKCTFYIHSETPQNRTTNQHNNNIMVIKLTVCEISSAYIPLYVFFKFPLFPTHYWHVFFVFETDRELT